MMEARHLLIIGSVWPEPGSSAAGRRMMELIEVFQSAGWDITFASTSTERTYAVDLSALGIHQVTVEINSSSFDDFVTKLQPDAVMFDRFTIEEQFGWRVAEHCPQTTRILDMEDVHCLRRARRRAVNEGGSFTKEDLLQSASAKREIASIFRCDLSLVISEYEMGLLQTLLGIDDKLLHYLPFRVDPIDEEQMKMWPPYETRAHFVTVGNFRHPPNWDAVQYLYHSVWPLLRQQLAEAEMHVYGAYSSKKAMQYHQPDKGFFIEGRVDDVQAEVQNARICLAPLRFGAGLKGKLFEAMQCGTPSVTTAIGAEGIAGEMEWGGAIAGSADELADAAVNLYQNEEAWKKAQHRGTAILNQRFSNQHWGHEFLQRIEEIQSNLKVHRLQNFTGAMLQHHTAASTKYMSRWIEAKNK